MFAKKPVVKAVEGVTIDVQSGEIFAFLGPNGAGKTTLIKMLCTLIFPTRGEAIVDGHDITKDDEAVRRSIGLVTGEERSFYWRLTGKQNLKFFGALHGLKSDEIQRKIEALVDLLDMQEYVDTRFNEYSTGMKQHLAVARCLLSDAKILFMDEPTKSLDHSSAEKLRRFIKERHKGKNSGPGKENSRVHDACPERSGRFCGQSGFHGQGSCQSLGHTFRIKKENKSSGSHD